MNFTLRVFLLGLFLLLPAGLRAAHLCTADPAPGDTRNEFQAWGGYSPHSGGPISSTPYTKFAVGGLLYSRRCWSWSNFSIGYNVGLIPAAIVSQPFLIYDPTPTILPAGGTYTIVGSSGPGPVLISFNPFAPARKVYGFAATPIGFTFDWWHSSRVYPFVQTDFGLIKSREPIPYPFAPETSLNFLLSMGGGIKVRLGKSLALSTGYKLMHISNAGRSSLNPGLDNNVVFAGISLLK